MAFGLISLILLSIAFNIEQSLGFHLLGEFPQLPDNGNDNKGLTDLKTLFGEKMLNMNISVKKLTRQYDNVEKVSESVIDMKKQMKDESQTIETLKTDIAIISKRLEKQCLEADYWKSFFLSQTNKQSFRELSFQDAVSSSTDKGGVAKLAIDGSTNPFFKDGSCSKSKRSDSTPWWLGTLTRPSQIHMVELYNRVDCCAAHMRNIAVQVYETDPIKDSDAVPKLCNEIVLDTNLLVKVACIRPLQGKYIRIFKNKKQPIHLCEIKAFGYIDPFGEVIQSSSSAEAQLAVDGDPKTCSETENDPSGHSWWQVSLFDNITVTGLTLTNRDDEKYTLLSNFEVRVSKKLQSACGDPTHEVCTSFKDTVKQGESVTLTCEKPMTGRFLRISKLTAGALSLCEVHLEKNALEK